MKTVEAGKKEDVVDFDAEVDAGVDVADVAGFDADVVVDGDADYAGFDDGGIELTGLDDA